MAGRFLRDFGLAATHIAHYSIASAGGAKRNILLTDNWRISFNMGFGVFSLVAGFELHDDSNHLVLKPAAILLKSVLDREN